MEKQQKIISMFNEISKTYDITNRVLSFGVDKSWRRMACDLAYKFYDKNSIEIIADVACGTGDMCEYWQKRANKNKIDVKTIHGIDPSSGMLDVAKQKLPQFSFTLSSATNLPFEDESVDIISISYGIRNVIDRIDAFKEFRRVLKPNGLLVILEFTKNEKDDFRSKLREFYMKKILPKIGGLVSKNYEAYQYLPDSIDNFLSAKMMRDELQEIGFITKYQKSFSFDISTLLISQKV
ncbi:MAG: bifunctional demethylmenaquinone methyltransferase/2-methoxy-6-polyprenyl-1,4-benzoquinol methylase UbiE [Campylobacterales bacterium]|nr:bifunctional demethylmenaquinone methyltransferase/2-methoxy-6-polyprenyl-1,4-benzoquinol methylase UbiE [Campylobacterales bacterium]